MARKSGSHPSRPLYQTKRWISVTLALVLLVGTGAFFYQKIRFHRTLGTLPVTTSGPWGDLQSWEINLEQPSEYVAFLKNETDGPFWNFGTLSSQEVEKTLEESGCSPEQIRQLLASQNPQKQGDFVIRPDDATILSLSPETRSKLYLVLAKNPTNALQANPHLIPSGGVEKMLNRKFQDPEQILALTKRLVYSRNGFSYFSDLEVVLRNGCTNDADRLAFRRAITATPAVMARLLVNKDSNIDTPLIYWGLTMPGVYLKDLRPLFEAQKQLPDGGSISILYLLPPIARSHLYATPLTPENGEKLPDCHWTALNFFNFKPDPRLADIKFATQYVMENFYEIGEPGIAGDLVFLLDPKGNVVHSATYLAGDLVYTKNGINVGQPWALMHIRDMVGCFSATQPVRVAFFRKKDY